MVQRVRQLNLAGLLNPAMSGLATLAESQANIGRGVASGLNRAGANIDDERNRVESKRRFGIESGMEERRLKVAEGRLGLEREEMLNQRAAASGLVDEATALSQELLVRSTLGAPVDEQAHQRLQGIINGIGGVDAAAQLSAMKGANGGALPTEAEENLPALEARLSDRKARLGAADLLLQRLAPQANKDPRAMKAYRDLLTARVGLDAQVNFDTLRHGEAKKRGAQVEKRGQAMAGGATFDAMRSVYPDVPDDVWGQVREQFGKPIEGGSFFGLNEAQQTLTGWRGERDKRATQERQRIELASKHVEGIEKQTKVNEQAAAIMEQLPQEYRTQARKRILAGENATAVKNDIDAQIGKVKEEKPVWTPARAKDAILKIVNDPLGQDDKIKRRSLANLGADALDMAYPYVGQPVRDMIDGIRGVAGGGAAPSAQPAGPGTAPSIVGPPAVERIEMIRGPNGFRRKGG